VHHLLALHPHEQRWNDHQCSNFATSQKSKQSLSDGYGQWHKAMKPTYLEGMEGIISCNIQRGTTRVVTQSSVCPQDVAHVLWVVLANALLQVISSSLQQDSIVIITFATTAFCIRLGQG